MANGRPGRPPKWKQGVIGKYYKMPLDLVNKLKSLVQSGRFSSEVEAIYHFVMFNEKAEEVAGELEKLRREIEVLRAENEAWRKRVQALKRERDEALEKAREWEEKYRELEARLAEVAGGVVEVSGGENVSLIDELERVDLVELAREFHRLNKALHGPGNFYVFLDGERVKRSEVEKRRKELRDRINKVLDLRGLPRAEAWKAINAGKFEALEKLEG
ncbi:conserved protein of unknown function [Thermococcus nautili]|uniref:hypothetical protein n=1 Tax=Thermococcus nautili TaxID=195522 RepID=UPI002552FA12|nr:hypothetical protein [Thermococcus nautili]CAI1492041.1 conserved protein of unknown function [Thermococcus nautili]